MVGFKLICLFLSGEQEAQSGGVALKNEGFKFDLAYTSVLKRANDTLTTVLQVLNQENIEVKKSWRLNERHYGGLTGLNKAETAKEYGDDQVKFHDLF